MTPEQATNCQLIESSDGVTVALHDMGGDGPPLLLTHGNGLNAGMWASVAPLLSHRYHCYGIDFRGQGAAHSTDPELPVDRPLFADDLLAVIDAIGGGPILTAGHSLGAVATVVETLRNPDTFTAAWLFEPVLVPDTFERPPSAAAGTLIEAARKRRQEFDSVDEIYERFRSKPPYSKCTPESVRAYVEIGTYDLPAGGVRLSCLGENEARVFESGIPQDFSTYAAVRTPMVIACGGTAEKGDVPAIVAPLVAEALGNATLETFSDLTHFGPMEDPEAIAASILRFFEKIGS